MNPQAGGGKSKDCLFDIVKSLNDKDCEVTVYTIEPGHRSVEQILWEHPGAYDIYACCGGDGTLNRFINACKKLFIRQPIRYYPLGSTNDFARNLWPNPDIECVSNAIARGEAFAYDLGNFNGTCFNYIAAFGAFTDVSYRTDQKFKDVLGYLAYVLNGIASLPQSLRQNIELCYTVNGVEHTGNYIFGSVSNSTSIGGFSSQIMHHAQLDDGLFEVVLVKAPAHVYELGEIAAALSTGVVNEKYMEMFQTDEIEFLFTKPVRWTLDGEDSGEEDKVTIRVEKNAMYIMV